MRRIYSQLGNMTYIIMYNVSKISQNIRISYKKRKIPYIFIK